MDEEKKFAGDVTNTCEGQALDNFRKQYINVGVIVPNWSRDDNFVFKPGESGKTTPVYFLAYPHFSEKNQFTL